MTKATSNDLRDAIALLYDAADAVRVIGDNIRKMKADGSDDHMWAISTINAVIADCSSVIGAIIMAERMAAQQREIDALRG